MGERVPAPLIKDGRESRWEGLVLEAYVPMPEDERRAAEASMPRRRAKLEDGFAGLGLIVVSGVLAWIRDFRVVAAASAALCLLFELAARYFAKLHYTHKATFVGLLEAIPPASQLGKAVRRLGLTDEYVEVEVLPDWTVWRINGRQWRGRVILAHPLAYRVVNRSHEAAALNDSELEELRANLIRTWENDLVLAAPALVGLAFVVPAFMLAWPAAVVLVVLGMGCGFGVFRLTRRRYVRLCRDAEEGACETVGNRRILMNSRKAWTIDGVPAPWRIRYLKIAARKPWPG